MYLDEDGNIRDNSNHDSLLAAGVPGTVAGMELAHQRYGSLEWQKLLQPAISSVVIMPPFFFIKSATNCAVVPL